MPRANRPFRELQPAQQAGILCNTDDFQKFAAIRANYPDTMMSSAAAAEYIRTICKVQSRRELNTDRAANARFQELRTAYDAWRGRIAIPPQHMEVTR